MRSCHDSIGGGYGVGNPSPVLGLKCGEFWSMFYVSSPARGNTVIDLAIYGVERNVDDTVHPPYLTPVNPNTVSAATHHSETIVLSFLSLISLPAASCLLNPVWSSSSWYCTVLRCTDALLPTQYETITGTLHTTWVNRKPTSEKIRTV